MIRHLVTLGLLLTTASGCRGSASEVAALEPPPPRIEAELAPESRLVDPRADALVRQMSDRLASVSAVALEAEEVYDEVPEQSPRRQLTNLRHVAMRRPDRLVGDAAGDVLNRSFWYDGKMFAALDREQQVWASGAAAGAGAGGVATAASSVTPAVIGAQSPQAFTLAVPLTVEIMTNVAVS